MVKPRLPPPFAVSLVPPSKGPSGERVEQRVGHGHEEGGLQHLTPGLAENLGQRGLDDLLLLLGHTEDRGLLHVNADHEADNHEDGGQQERHAPAPRQHRALVIEGLEHEVGAVGQEEADRCAKLREGAVQRALVFRRVLGGDQCRTGPFAAQADALDEAQQAEDGDCCDADLVIGGQAADEERADTHGHEADDQRSLAAHTVTEVTEHQRAQWAGNEGDGEGQQAHQQGDGRVGLVGEEDVREVVCRGSAVGVEIVEFDGGSNHRCSDHGLDRIANHGSGLTCRLSQASLFDCCSHW